METIRITTSQNIDIDYEVAGLGERMVARLIDMALFVAVLIFAVIITSLTRTGGTGYSAVMIGLLIIYALLYVFYDLLSETLMNGQSIGKRIMKVKVISLDGTQPTFGQYLLRWLFRLIDFSLTFQIGGLICVAVSDKHQRIGDIVAGTTLIKTLPRTQINHISYLDAPETYDPVFPEAGQLSAKDISLIQDVINTYIKTHNSVIVYNMAIRIREHLGIAQTHEMNDMKFLQTIIKDYGHVVAAQEGMA